MRRGILSFIFYILYTLTGGGLAIYAKIEADRIQASGGGWEGLGAAILLILGIIVAGVGLVGVLFKALHLGTHWGIFGFICLLLDVAIIVVLVSNMFESGSFVFNPLGGILCGISAISMVSNFESLRN